MAFLYFIAIYAFIQFFVSIFSLIVFYIENKAYLIGKGRFFKGFGEIVYVLVFLCFYVLIFKYFDVFGLEKAYIPIILLALPLSYFIAIFIKKRCISLNDINLLFSLFSLLSLFSLAAIGFLKSFSEPLLQSFYISLVWLFIISAMILVFISFINFILQVIRFIRFLIRKFKAKNS
ncbi:hypothetical protein BKH44_04740 [Helicobacter sp. 13S00477-4]|nr:hypothetical protein BKH44_04740 [Helicobacter sp. 13S00477-4]